MKLFKRSLKIEELGKFAIQFDHKETQSRGKQDIDSGEAMAKRQIKQMMWVKPKDNIKVNYQKSM